MIRVYIAEDHAGMRAMLKMIVEDTRDLELVGESIDGADVADRVLELRPDVVLLDVMMPAVDGIDATRQVRQKMPEARILMFSAADGDEYILNAIAAGANGYLLKEHAASQLINAIREIAHGRTDFWLDAAISDRWRPHVLASMAERTI